MFNLFNAERKFQYYGYQQNEKFDLKKATNYLYRAIQELNDNRDVYFAKDEPAFSHLETLRSLLQSLLNKIEKKNTSCLQELNKNENDEPLKNIEAKIEKFNKSHAELLKVCKQKTEGHLVLMALQEQFNRAYEELNVISQAQYKI